MAKHCELVVACTSQAYLDCHISSSGDGLPKDCQELKGQALDCLRDCMSPAAQYTRDTASPDSDSKQLGSSGSLPSGRPHRSFDIEEGGAGAPMTSLEPEQASETDDHTSQWQLSAESRSSSARGITSLVLVNPRALYSALNRYSMAVTDRLASTLQHSLSAAGHHPVPPSSSVHQAAEADGSPQEEGGSSQNCRSRQLLASARRLLLEHVQAVEALASERGYTESLLQDGDPTENEQYTNRHADPLLTKAVLAAFLIAARIPAAALDSVNIPMAPHILLYKRYHFSFPVGGMCSSLYLCATSTMQGVWLNAQGLCETSEVFAG